MRMQRISVSLPEQQMSWLQSEAKRIGITVGELLRRLIDRVREST
jgi:Arc/MetJ-type ribon-helix-helix transcriptional regulator